MALVKDESGNTRLNARVRMAGRVIRGDGSTEEVEFDEPGEHMVELSYQDTVALLGQEEADALWKDVPDEERN